MIVLVAVDPVLVKIGKEAFRRTLARLDWNRKYASGLMGISVWELCRQENHRGFNSLRLAMLGQVALAIYQQEFLALLKEQWATPVTAEQGRQPRSMSALEAQ